MIERGSGTHPKTFETLLSITFSLSVAIGGESPRLCLPTKVVVMTELKTNDNLITAADQIDT